MAEERVQRRLAAILAADVVGYSRMMEADEEGTRARLRNIQSDLIAPLITADGGRIVKTTGDGILVEFPSAVGAVRNALAIQSAMAEQNAEFPDFQKLVYRIGINIGDVIIEGDDIHGDGVNMAARLEGLCGPGEVYVSASVFDQVRGKLEASFDDLGEQTVKNISRPVRVYRAQLGSVAAPAHGAMADALVLPDKPSIAILAFENMSGDPEQEYFSDGISEDIITALSRIRWFFVIARNSSFSYKGQSPDVRQVAKDLGVRYVMEGSVRKSANRVRITVQLVDGQTGNHIWADRYDRELEDIFAVQDEITQVVVGTIEPEMARSEQERARIKAPEHLDAWEAYQRGMWHAHPHRNEEFSMAEKLFRQAIELDPDMSPAYSALSELLGRQALSGSDAPEQAISDALAIALKAVQLDPTDAVARCALGRAYFLGRSPEKAIVELQKSIELNPSYAHAYFSLGATLVSSGKAESSISHLELARRLSPRDYLLGSMMGRQAMSYLFMNQYDQALEWGKRAVDEDGSWLHNYLGYVSALGHLGRLDEAREACASMLAINEDVSIAFFLRRSAMTHEPDRDHLLEGLRKAGLPEGYSSEKHIPPPLPDKPSIAGPGGVAVAESIFRRPAVAVLPFENMSGDPEQEYFVDGLT
ncbi:MAG: hypothetical protein HQ514_15765, partial [Rhodospirillales bacterium]|nr:hypothetical protein [Rhodospirillales bacterium]